MQRLQPNQMEGIIRDRLLSCIERYMSASNSTHLIGANQLARLYFSPARDIGAATRIIGDIEETYKRSCSHIDEPGAYLILQRYTSCAKTDLCNPHVPIEARFWNAIDDLAEADMMNAHLIGNNGTNPADLIERVKSEYRTLSPFSITIPNPDHPARYGQSGGTP